MNSIKDRFIKYIHTLQDQICSGLEAADGSAMFEEDNWKRDGGGGGRTRVIADGDVIEKGGVNTSVVFGKLGEMAKKQLKVDYEDFFACGLSLVIHPKSPMVPTIHMNVRYFEIYDDQGDYVNGWFGGGTDLTPYYLDKEDAKFFHTSLKAACDPFGKELYPEYKDKCDKYFYNSHRGETRGIGGVFFDYLKPTTEKTSEDWMQMTQSVGDSFLPIYSKIIATHKEETYTPEQKVWQEIRRGRYVEFNLLHDRGTHFGIKTNGRTESVLMSLPPTVRWEYMHEPERGSREAELVENLKAVDWV
jgi:coproporphyrinogen III oxidase|tara:strand:- start:16221 stop:17129 length:909 start_codon:yes stop_codon:yes gene_type:complete